MRKRILTSLLAVSLLPALLLPVCAEGIQETVQSETESTQATTTAVTVPTTIPVTAPTITEPVILEEQGPLLEIDLENKYKGMVKSYQDGYTPTVVDGTLRITIPLLKKGDIQGPIDVQLDGLPAGIPEDKLLLQQINMETISLEGGVLVENVFLLNFEIPISDSITPGAYPVQLKITDFVLTEPIEIAFPQTITIPQPQETTPTEPEETEPEQTQPTEPTIPEIPTVLEIDSSHIYSGMDTAYEDGYLPRIEDGIMHIVLPLRCSGALWDNKLDAAVSLDSSASSPFVVENLQKTFYLESIIPENSTEPQDIYLVSFDILLAEGRRNGTYPVTINASGFDYKGSPIKTTFTLYITITDGKVDKPVVSQVDTPTAEPVVYISKTVIEPEAIQAGKSFTMTVTLKNSITTKFVRNMLVTVDTGNVQIDLEEDSNIFPVDRIDAGGEVELTVHFSTDTSLPSGKYPITFSFKYDSSKTLNLSSTGASVVEIKQPANMELVMPRFSTSVSAGETVPMSFQVMNMGRSAMFNVRCVVSGFGFAPSNTGYIGTMGAGTSANTKVDLYIIPLNASEGNENGPQYGQTTGTVTLIYEDEAGQEYQQETTFDTTVNRPVVELPENNTEEEEEERRVGSWWISVGIMAVLLAGAISAIMVLQKKKKGGRFL